MSDGLRWSLRWRLSVLWTLEWGITGTILTYLPLYLTEIRLSTAQQGQLMAVTAVGLWVAPFLVGQVADRWLASEKYLALSHFLGGLTLFVLPFATELYKETEENFSTLLFLFGLYAMAYFPTVPLASSLTFRHLKNPKAQFGLVRVWGTVGWMLAGFGLSVWLGQEAALQWLSQTAPEWITTIETVKSALVWLPPPSSTDCFRIAAVLSFALSSFCVFLPSTPPARSARDGIAPLAVLRMFGDRQFSLMIGVSFLLSLVVPLYTLQVPRLLEQLEFRDEWIPAVMLVGQISEFPALLFLPLCFRHFGLKTTFALGMGAWFIRYTLFAFEGPLELILLGLALHGVCHVFLVIVIQLYIDSQCRSDVRASAQNLFAFITMGIGMPAGALLGGLLGDWLQGESGEINYHVLFAIPAAFILGVMCVYWRWFRVMPERAEPGEAGGRLGEG